MISAALLLTLAMSPLQAAAAEVQGARALQARLASVHGRVAPAVVALVERGRDGNFEETATGVLVSAGGLVLTAAHCLDEPGDTVSMRLADGRLVEGRALGMDVARDFGLIQLEPLESLPSVGIRPDAAGTLTADEGLVMYGFPDGGEPGRGAVPRLGTYLGRRGDGMLRTSCAMMPGDSGGPLFDLDGRLVGINCEIGRALASNFHAGSGPILADFGALRAGEVTGERARFGRWRTGQEPRPVAADADASRLIPGGRAGLAAAFTAGAAAVAPSLVEVSSTLSGGWREGALGLVVGDGTMIVTKGSRVSGESVRVRDAEGGLHDARVERRDPVLDLCLLRIADALTAAALGSDAADVAPMALVATPLPRGEEPEPSLVGAGLHPARRRTWGMIGITLPGGLGGPPRVRQVTPGRPAADAGMAVGDLIVTFDGAPTPTRVELRAALRETTPGQTVAIDVERGGRTVAIELTLGSSQELRLGEADHVAYRTRVSERRGGFGPVLRHDARLGPARCGGPLIDLDGRVVGLNIARVDRVGCLALPVEAVRRFVQGR